MLLAVAVLLASQATLVKLAIFSLLSGAAGSVHQPAARSAAADGRDGPTGARAAAMLSATGALAPTLAAPLLVAPAAWWGWRGDFVAMAAFLLLLAGIAGAKLGRRPPTGVARVGYGEVFRQVAVAPGALPLLLGSTLRATVWLGWLAYLPAYLVERFAASSATVALCWSLGGGAIFVMNLGVARLIGMSGASGWRTPERLLPASLLAMVVLAPTSLMLPTVPLTIVGTTLCAWAFGVSVGATIGLLVRRYTALRGAVLGLNAAGANLGLFVGASIGGLTLGAGGYSGLALGLTLLAGGAFIATFQGLRRVGAGLQVVTASAAD